MPSLRILSLTCASIVILLALLAAWSDQIRSRAQARAAATRQLEEDLPYLHRAGGYVSSNRCRSCHPAEYVTWHDSFHRTMTQVAQSGNVLGEFDGSTIVSEGLEYRVFQREDQYWAEMPDPDVMMYVVQGGKQLEFDKVPRVERRIVMTTGSHHYQTYWVESQRYERLMQTLPLVYLIRDNRWIPREEAFMRPAHGPRMITQWNHHCIRCHSTGGIPGLDRDSGMLNSRVGELGIACEACHGPGEEHVRLNRDPRQRYRAHVTGQGDQSIVNPARLDHRRSSEVCGQCHGVYIMREEFAMKYAYEGIQYRPGQDLHATRYYIQHPALDPTGQRHNDLRNNPEFFRERWWDDGTVLAGGREFTALAGSGCFQRGEISCLACHTMHGHDPNDQLRRDVRGNASCTQCHDQAEFTTGVDKHTYHPPDSAGSECLNCHMPYTSYALFGAVRNHQMGSPNIASSARYGVPNACNLCHLDQTLQWTQQYLVKRYGMSPETLSDEQQTTSAALLWMLKGDAAQRAITAWHVGWQPAQEASGAEWMAPLVAWLLDDPYGVVRYVAGRALRKLPGFSSFDYDFLASPAQRQWSVSEAISRWRERSPDDAFRPHVRILINEDGTVQAAEIAELLRHRNDRPVAIKE